MKLYLFNLFIVLFIVLFMVGALLQGIGSAFGAITQSNNVDKTLSSQRMENEKNRQYNLQLAKLQNEWNLQQWERENEYNNPLNQMQRLKAAGLNPNLVYGNGAGQSTSAPSPQLTSGSPSMPQDMSLLASRPTIGTIMSQGLQNEMMRAQIDATKAGTRKTLADAGISETQLKYEDVKQRLGVDISQQQYDNMKEEFNVLFEQGRKYALENEGLSYENFIKKIDSDFKERKAHVELEQLKQNLNISEKEAEYLVKTMAVRILGTELDTELKGYESEINSPELIKKLPEGIKPLVSLLNLIFRGH